MASQSASYVAGRAGLAIAAAALFLAASGLVGPVLSAAPATNTLEGGAAGKAVTVANSGGTSGTAFDTVRIASNSSVTYDSSRAAHGALSMRLQATGGATWVQWRKTVGVQSVIWGRAYVFVPSALSRSVTAFRALNGTKNAMSVRITAARQIEILDSGNVVRARSTNVLPVGAWARIEFYVDPIDSGSGDAEVRLFNSPDSSSPTESLLAKNRNYSTQVTTYRFGQTQGRSSTTVWLDDLNVNTSGWSGPASEPSPPAPQCSDGVDNDGDGATDFPADPGCDSEADEDETIDSSGAGTVVAAAGDIACSSGDPNYEGADPNFCQHRRTAQLLNGADAVVTLGDNVYEQGTLTQFNISYDPTWGQYASRTYPTPGNHEYNDPAGGARGYFDYWASKGRPTGGAGLGYYSWDIGSWHMISLNTSKGAEGRACETGPSCAEGSPQNDWLEQDLASVPESSCIVAYWHHPLFNSGSSHGNQNTSAVKALWDDLYAAGADIILNGHEHNYQRYAPMTPEGVVSPAGIREFVSGGGGKNLKGFLAAKDPGFETGISAFGVLKLQLGADGYAWQFVDINGTVRDSGGPLPCHGPGAEPSGAQPRSVLSDPFNGEPSLLLPQRAEGRPPELKALDLDDQPDLKGFVQTIDEKVR